VALNIRKSYSACSQVRTSFSPVASTSTHLDMSLSKDLTDSFKLRMIQDYPDAPYITFSIKILGMNFCPLNPPTGDFVTPTEIAITYDHFQKYYQTKHSGRKLTWLWNYSTNELLTNYLNQKYILVTNSYQMAVLLQYNRHDTLSLNEIQAATAISNNTISQVLSQLVKAKILISQKKEQYDLNPSTFYQEMRSFTP
jgi:cullin 1